MNEPTPFDMLMAALEQGSRDSGDEMSEPIDVKGPWWTATKLPFLDSHYSTGWASIGLTIQRFFGGEPFFEKHHTASLKEGDNLAEFTKRFEEKFPHLKIVKYDRPENPKDDTAGQYIAEHGAACVEFDGDSKIELHVVTRDGQFLNEATVWFGENTTKSIPKGRVHVLISTSQGPEFKSMGIGGQKLERANYEDEVLRGYDRIITDLQAASPAGRVAILDGKPGTGKTFLVRGILDDVKDVIFVIVPANLIQELAQPSMIPALVGLHQSRGDKPMVFIIEDADEVLAPRMGDNMSSVSAILNLGDGILGQLLDVRIVATTNAHHTDVDEAIKRPGRLSAMVHVGPLSPGKAGEVYTRLTGKPPFSGGGDPMNLLSVPEPVKPLFTRETSLATVYQMARDSGWTPPPKERKMGFGASDEDDDYDD